MKPGINKENRLRAYSYALKIMKLKSNSMLPAKGICRELLDYLKQYHRQEVIRALKVRNTSKVRYNLLILFFPELKKVKPVFAVINSLWWSNSDYDSRINALERMIELAGVAKK